MSSCAWGPTVHHFFDHMNLLTVVILRVGRSFPKKDPSRRVLARYTKYGTVILGLIQAG